MLHLPYEPHWFEKKSHIRLTQNGLRLSIDERLRFAKSLPASPVTTAKSREATAVFLGHLVSNRRAQTRILRKRINGVLSQEGQQALDFWVAVPLSRSLPWTLREPASVELWHIFDMPGFPPLQSNLQFTELLPYI
jgi:hypothetical protein